MSVQKETPITKIRPYAKNPRTRTLESLEKLASLNQAGNPLTN
jgi:hypothetical protein